jgi:Rad3-related DNA helicase
MVKWASGEAVQPIPPGRRRNKTVDMLDMFGPGGRLSRAIPNYEYRQEQVTLTGAILDALELGSAFAGEAGTGVRKSQAYILGTAASGKKVLVATFTKALQDQLLSKDIPIMQAIFPHITAAVLKGRRNYLCLREYQEALTLDGQGELEFGGPHQGPTARKLMEWTHPFITGLI